MYGRCSSRSRGGGVVFGTPFGIVRRGEVERDFFIVLVTVFGGGRTVAGVGVEFDVVESMTLVVTTGCKNNEQQTLSYVKQSYLMRYMPRISINDLAIVSYVPPQIRTESEFGGERIKPEVKDNFRLHLYINAISSVSPPKFVSFAC